MLNLFLIKIHYYHSNCYVAAPALKNVREAAPIQWYGSSFFFNTLRRHSYAIYTFII